MATQAELVTLGFSPVQAELIMAAQGGSPDVAQMVTNGLWAETASVVANLSSTAAELVRAGFSTVQADAIR